MNGGVEEAVGVANSKYTGQVKQPTLMTWK